MKNFELCYEHPACNIYYNSQLNVVHAQWNGVFVKGEMLRKIYNQLIVLVKEKQTSAILNDARKMKVINDDDQHWMMNNWIHRAYAGGFCIEAILVAEGTFGDLTLKKLIKQYDASKIVTRFFTDYSEASEWLKVFSSYKEWTLN